METQSINQKEGNVVNLDFKDSKYFIKRSKIF